MGSVGYRVSATGYPAVRIEQSVAPVDKWTTAL